MSSLRAGVNISNFLCGEFFGRRASISALSEVESERNFNVESSAYMSFFCFQIVSIRRAISPKISFVPEVFAMISATLRMSTYGLICPVYPRELSFSTIIVPISWRGIHRNDPVHIMRIGCSEVSALFHPSITSFFESSL